MSSNPDSKYLIAIDPLLADRSRLALMSKLLASKDSPDFMTLLDGLQLSRGNLSSHLRKLEEAAFITVTKEFVERKPRTTYRATAKGKKAVIQYLEQIERVLKVAKEGK